MSHSSLTDGFFLLVVLSSPKGIGRVTGFSLSAIWIDDELLFVFTYFPSLMLKSYSAKIVRYIDYDGFHPSLI